MTEKRQTSQGYIIRILQHFATKLWNIINFVMLFQAVMKFLSRLVEIKILSITQVVNLRMLSWFISSFCCGQMLHFSPPRTQALSTTPRRVVERAWVRG
jgi:hypothetical protein